MSHVNITFYDWKKKKNTKCTLINYTSDNTHPYGEYDLIIMNINFSPCIILDIKLIKKSTGQRKLTTGVDLGLSGPVVANMEILLAC